MTRQEQPHPRADDGFSLAELTIVVLIMGVLLAIAIASFVYATGATARVSCLSNQRSLEKGVETYVLDNEGAVPSSMEDLREYVTHFDTAIICPRDSAVDLGFTETSGTVTIDCALHPR